MSSRAFKPKRFVIGRIDQDPVRFDMAIMRWPPFANKRMIPVFGIKQFSFGQKPYDILKFIQVLPAFPHALDIAGELGGLRNRLHFFQLSNMASRDSNS